MKKRKTTKARTRNAETLTESEYFSKIRSALRNAFRYWKPAMKALENASRPSQSSNKLLKKEYQCATCKGFFPRKSVDIDHIIECGSLRSYEDIVPFLKRLTTEDVSGFQVLCKDCHKKKTASVRNNKKQL